MSYATSQTSLESVEEFDELQTVKTKIATQAWGHDE